MGLCSVLMAFEQGGVFIVSHLLWQGVQVFPFWIFRIEGPPTFNRYERGCWGPNLMGLNSVASYDTQDNAEGLFWPGSSRDP
jgi:hypothetical protein